MSKTHDKCKYFGFKACPHIEDDIMKRANQVIHKCYGGEPNRMLEPPTNEEINKICVDCNEFTHK